ncbi:hypothetical protein J8F10_02060 [Gemmata sp. G18]|uniref:Uncharacterized protein n=1 Tax=Gemmata palustris TaxID=2822762 RepID=A0ABS5BL88_9BACT|nr:hypothetical protein [Gemmata palustris]MBP3954080.1 hypothetical protein [Gemmata palustris]
MPELNGKWQYRSFCPRVAANEFRAQITAPWTPLSVMNLTTTDGKISGTATPRPGAALNVRGSVTPPVPESATGEPELLPEGIELVIDGLAGAVYNLRGFFTPGTDHIVGTVVAISNDLAGRPVGTSGPFILFPDKA